MVTPNPLLEADAPDVGGDRAPLAPVQPSVQPPLQVVGYRVSVFNAETREQYLGVAIGHIVAIAIRIKEQVGRLHDEDAAMPKRQAGSEVEPGDEVLHLAIMA